MKAIFLIQLLAWLALTISCKKHQEIQPSIPTNNNDELKVEWKSALDDSSKIYLSMDPQLHADLLISSFQPIDTSINEVLISLNKNNGAFVWSWEDYIRPAPQTVRGSNRIHTKNDLLLACSSQDNYAINMNSGQTIWASNIDDGNHRTSQFEELLFHTITYGNAPFGDSSIMVMHNVAFGDWKRLYGVTKIDDYEVHLESPAVFIDENADTLLIFQNRQIDLYTYEDKVDLICYNMSADSMFWYKPDFTPSGSSNVRTPIVEGDLIYFAGKLAFYCMNILTGEVIWTHNFYYDYQGSNFLIHNSLIITNLDNGDLIAINKNTGTQVWVNEALSGCCTELRIYEDRIYFGNDKLFIVDASNGELLHKYKSPHSGGSFRNAIAVDVENDRMYTTDGIYLMCMELPD